MPPDDDDLDLKGVDQLEPDTAQNEPEPEEQDEPDSQDGEDDDDQEGDQPDDVAAKDDQPEPPARKPGRADRRIQTLTGRLRGAGQAD